MNRLRPNVVLRLSLAGLTLALALAVPSSTPAQDYRAQRRDAVVKVVERVGPAVVNISTEVVRKNPFADSPFDMDPFEFFFGGGGRPKNRVEHSLGSGVIVDPKGFVLTNEHVIANASKITVTLADRREVSAKIVGSDTASDLAVLQLDGAGPWPAAQMGSSDDLMIGETMIAIGNPLGLQNTVTMGVVSALGRTLSGPDETPYADFIQTDAAINFGNSGGGLFNILGDLVGINSQIAARGQNLGFAIPIDRARKVYRELTAYGKVRPVWTGLVLEDLEPSEARDLGLKEGRGVFVRRLFGDSPASAAGLQAGDLITALNGQKLTSVPEFDTAIARTAFGNTVVVQIQRGANTLERRLTVQQFPKEKAPSYAWSALGLKVATGREMVMIEDVRENSPAAQVGLTAGLGITEVNGKEIRSVEDFNAAIPEALYRRSVFLMVRARDGFYRVPLPLTPIPQARRSRR